MLICFTFTCILKLIIVCKIPPIANCFIYFDYSLCFSICNLLVKSISLLFICLNCYYIIPYLQCKLLSNTIIVSFLLIKCYSNILNLECYLLINTSDRKLPKLMRTLSIVNINILYVLIINY